VQFGQEEKKKKRVFKEKKAGAGVLGKETIHNGASGRQRAHRKRDLCLKGRPMKKGNCNEKNRPPLKTTRKKKG